MKIIPYGMANYIQLRRRNGYLVDKTGFIPKLEEAGDYLMLIRPRRMGKSLLINTLEAYYDIWNKDQFEKHFGGTKIFESPTAWHHQYFILGLDFSGLHARPDLIANSFDAYGKRRLDSFFSRYKDFFDDELREKVLTKQSFHDQLGTLFEIFQTQGLNLYILIDEYDNFTNTILTSAGLQSYLEITKASGFYRAFFALIKSAAGRMEVGEIRLFITGVSPVTMDDVTSGFNIGTNLSLDPGFQELLGFTESEVSALVHYYNQQGVLPLDPAESIHRMNKWYDNYRFSAGAENSIFNSDMVLYVVGTAIRQRQFPPYLIDQNIRIDYGKLRFLLMEAKKPNGNFDRLRDLITVEDPIEALIATSFPAEKIAYSENFISLLCYFGLITYQDPKLREEQLVIPNQTVRQLIIGYLIEAFDEGLDFSPDFFLQPMLIHYSKIRYSYLIELRFIGRKDSVEKLLPQKIQEAKQQLAQYEQDSKLQRLSDGTEAKKLLLVFHGWEPVQREELGI